MEIILASASPRRRVLLEMLSIRGASIRVIPAGTDEDDLEDELSVEERVLVLARAKACEVALKCRADCVIIAADTLVCLDGEIMGKPSDSDDAVRMLRLLSGREHEVYTGVCVIHGEHEITRSQCTHVRFRELSEREIAAYVASGDPMDKAGAYGAQGRAALFIERIDGDYFNVVGLPLCLLGQMTAEIGINLL